jgi:hypothetical protein
LSLGRFHWSRKLSNMNCIEVAGMDDLIATLEVIKDAVHAGELDAQIEQASGALRAGFAKKK